MTKLKLSMIAIEAALLMIPYGAEALTLDSEKWDATAIMQERVENRLRRQDYMKREPVQSLQTFISELWLNRHKRSILGTAHSTHSSFDRMSDAWFEGNVRRVRDTDKIELSGIAARFNIKLVVRGVSADTAVQSSALNACHFFLGNNWAPLPTGIEVLPLTPLELERIPPGDGFILPLSAEGLVQFIQVPSETLWDGLREEARSSEHSPPSVLVTKLECIKNFFPMGASESDLKKLKKESKSELFNVESLIQILRKREEPQALLKKLFNSDSNRFLFFGESNHNHVEGMRHFGKFLERNGEDPHLTRVFIERLATPVTRALLEQMSLEPMSEAQRKESFEALDESSRISLLRAGGEAENIYFLFKLLPQLVEVNRRRLAKGYDPILVRPIDGAEDLDLNRGSDRLKSNGRELMTAKNFSQELKMMKPEDKSVVYYHIGHLIQGGPEELSGEKKDFLDQVEAEPEAKTKTTWLRIVFSQQPDLRGQSKIVLMDESDILYHERGVLTLTSEFLARNALAEFGAQAFEMREIESLIPTISSSIDYLEDTGSIKNYGLEFREQFQLSDLVDALIITPYAADRSKSLMEQELQRFLDLAPNRGRTTILLSLFRSTLFGMPGKNEF